MLPDTSTPLPGGRPEWPEVPLMTSPMIDQKSLLSAMLLGLPLGAAALDLRDRPMHGLLVVPEASAPAESTEARSPAPRLRDALKQSVSESDPASKPYRLSPEERQRMREQLRGRLEQAAQTQ